MKIVNDIIARKPIASNFIRPEALVIDALNLLSSVNLSYLVVMEGNTYEGIFSERDYSRNLVLKGRSSSTTKVQEVMSTDFPFVELNDTVEYCMNMMNTHKTRYLVAYEKGRFAGVITIHDLLRQVLFNREEVFDYSIASELIDNDESSKVF
jgi:predicted transcriptional regulator